jgi:hypothetical protein
MSRRRIARRPTKREVKAYTEHLDRLITLLWARSALREVRDWPSIWVLRAWLDSERAASEAAYRGAYRSLILVLTNQGGVAQWPDGRPPQVQDVQICLDAHARRRYDQPIFTVLDSVGLFNREYPFEHLARQTLVAHLLLADEEITEARRLPEPFPWPFALWREEGQPLRLWTDLDIRDQEQRIRARLERALFAVQQPVVHLPPTSQTAERHEEKAAGRRRAAARCYSLYCC